MRLLVILGLILSSNFAAAGLNIKPLAQEMTAMTRAMDLLFARQEMKESLTLSMLRGSLNKATAGSVTDQKVALLTNEKSLESCQITHNETKSADGSESNALVEYKGADCPLYISGKVHVVMGQMGADAQVTLNLKLTSAALQSELDLNEFEMPMNMTVGAVQTPDGGFAMDTKMTMEGKIHSQTMGLVGWNLVMDSRMTFADTGIAMKAVTEETYASAEERLIFSIVSEANNAGQTETYAINGVATSKEDFEKQHETVAMPGFDSKPEPLAANHVCNVKTYDTGKYSLEAVRKSIKDNTIETLTPAENLPAMFFMQTGKMTSPAFAGLMLEASVTPDAVRFSFEKKGMNGQPDEQFGRLTYVLGEKAELTKVILNRVVRITCQP